MGSSYSSNIKCSSITGIGGRILNNETDDAIGGRGSTNTALLTLGSGGVGRLGAYSMYQNEMIEIFSKLT